MKNFSSLRAKTFEFQSSPNKSKDFETYFRSLLCLSLDQSEYYSDTEELMPPAYSGKWKFTCQKLSAENEYFGGQSITVRLKEVSSTEMSTLNDLNLEERIIISILTKKNNISDTFLSYNLNEVWPHYPHFLDTDNQQITLKRNLTVNWDEYEDNEVENTKLVEYEFNDHIIDGDLIQIFCFSNKRLYSFGAYVEALWENGTAIRISEKIYEFPTKPQIYLSANSRYLGNKLFSDKSSANKDMLYFLSEEIQVELGMKQINCYMPVWVDAKWEKVTREINVVPK